MNKTKTTLLLSVLLFSILIPFVTSAQPLPDAKDKNTKVDITKDITQSEAPGTSNTRPLISCGGKDQNGLPQKDCDLGDLFNLMQSIINLVFIFAGLVVAAMFMYAGFLLITASGNSSQIQKAKNIFRRVVIGFIIMFLSYIIVRSLITQLDLNDQNGIKQFFEGLFKDKTS